jgi:hypothetical protein
MINTNIYLFPAADFFSIQLLYYVTLRVKFYSMIILYGYQKNKDIVDTAS